MCQIHEGPGKIQRSIVYEKGRPRGTAYRVRREFVRHPWRATGTIVFCILLALAGVATGFWIRGRIYWGRAQGESDPQPGYEPTQWVTDFEVRDFRAALAYLKARPDADPTGVGFFGVSKGASAGVLVGADDPYVRCFVTDGMFATYSTLVPYLQKGIAIVSTRYWLQRALPAWYYGLFAYACMREIRRQHGWRFPKLEEALPKLAPRPLLMIHGEADTYIKPSMAEALAMQANRTAASTNSAAFVGCPCRLPIIAKSFVSLNFKPCALRNGP